MKRIIFLTFLILLAPLRADREYDFKMLLLTGNSAVHSGRAYTGISETYNGSFFYNPASIANEVSTSTSLNYGSIDGSYLYPSIGTVLPNRYFKSGFEYSSIYYFDKDVIDAHILSFAAAQSLNKYYDLGLSINYAYLNRFSSASYLSFTLGALYHIDYEYALAGPFGIYDFNAGIKLTPGFYLGEDSPDGYSGMSNYGLGYSFLFYRDQNLRVKWFQEVALLTDYVQLPFKHGFEAEIRRNYLLRFGTTYPDAYGFGDVTLGAGYKLLNDTFYGSIDYSLVHRDDEEFVHYVGLQFSFSSSIRRDDDVRLVPRNYYFSPNGDGVLENVEILTQQYDNIREWELTIRNKNDTVVKRMTYNTVNTGTIIDQMLSTESAFQLPEKFIWDGTDNSGERVSDGIYTAVLSITTNNGRLIEKRTPSLVVDTRPSEVKVHADKTLLSPQTEYCNITHTKVSEADSTTVWRARIKQREGDFIAMQYEWRANELPEEIQWEGVDKDGNPAPDGVYSYTLVSTDRAGNTYTATIASIMLVSGLVKIGIDTDKIYYGAEDERILFIRDIPQQEMIGRSSLVLLSQNEKFAEIENPHALQFAEYPLSSLKDGIYSYFLKVYYVTGDNPESNQKPFIVDRTKPELGVSISPEVLTSDTAKLSVKTEVVDVSGIHHWQMRLLYEGRVLSRSSGSGQVPVLVSLPVSYNSELFQPYSRCTLEITLHDNAGNVLTQNIALPSIEVEKLHQTLLVRLQLAKSEDESIGILRERGGALFSAFSRGGQALSVDIYTDDVILADSIETELLDAHKGLNLTVHKKQPDQENSVPYLILYKE